MPYDKLRDIIYDHGISHILDALNQKHSRADRDRQNKDIFCKICEKIQGSKLVLVDITGNNPNVMIELGLDVGFGKRVILLIEKSEEDKPKIPTDLTSLEYFEYDSLDTFRSDDEKKGFCSFITRFLEPKTEHLDAETNEHYLTIKGIHSSKSTERTLEAKITPLRMRKGDTFTTEVTYKGCIRGGFFDNCVTDQSGKIMFWNWSHESLPYGSDTAKGSLNGIIEARAKWSCNTARLNPGKYDVHVRVYEHPNEGIADRYVLKEKTITIEITAQI